MTRRALTPFLNIVPMARSMTLIADNLASIDSRIANAVRRAGRDPETVRLVAVSKQVPIETIEEAGQAGQILFGENKVQEALQKMESLDARHYHWHFIGHVQKNKARNIVGRFDRVHSVEGLPLAETLHRLSVEKDVVTAILVQVNVSGEESKFGVAPEYLEELLVQVSRMPGVSVRGLMTIPPYDPDPQNSRRYFSALRELRDRMDRVGIENIILSELSMGMSNDFEVAIEEGATWVRIGTAIFGARE